MKHKIIVGTLAVFLFTGCVSIPPEAPELSIELGKRISAIEKSNIQLLHSFFNQKRKEVDKFIEDEWIPEFAENVFSEPTTSIMWDKVIKEGSKEDRLQFLIITGPILQLKINEKRLELIQPLDQLEKSIEQSLREEYTQVRAINNSISSLLLSASKVENNRNRYLEMLGVTENKTGKILNKTDELVTSLLDKAEGAPKKADKVIDFIKKINSLKKSI